jgi:hypothetical protein
LSPEKVRVGGVTLVVSGAGLERDDLAIGKTLDVCVVFGTAIGSLKVAILVIWSVCGEREVLDWWAGEVGVKGSGVDCYVVVYFFSG